MKFFLTALILFISLTGCRPNSVNRTDNISNSDSDVSDVTDTYETDESDIVYDSEIDEEKNDDADHQDDSSDTESEDYPDLSNDEDVFTPWTPILPKKEKHGIWNVIWVSGTPFEMGFQQGQLLYDEIANGIKNSEYVKEIKSQITIASLASVDKYASMNSYPDIVQECEGMVASAGTAGWTMELCLFINFGDVMVEILDSLPIMMNFTRPGCSQMMVTGDATIDGRLYHARMLDWAEIDYLLWYPTIIVRQPIDGIPHVYIGFPGNLSPYSGMNVAGISGGSNESDPFDGSQNDYFGRSHVQMLGQILKHSHTLDEAVQFVEKEDHMAITQFGIADAANNTAGVFEMTAKHMAVRRMENDVLWMSNHFVHPEMENYDADPVAESSRRRFDRFAQLVPEDGIDSMFGKFDPAEVVKVMRDRVNPDDGSESPLGTFDDNKSIGSNGAIYSIVFDPGNLHFWVAAGKIPVPEQEFTGFSLGTLLNWPGAVPVEPEVIN
ncbi:MAG TPA: C45 family autoproteolytic acyltransferase/hydrolase [bacterium]|nr:C45 family autoproteolytic acyltransferase/hydrolase [bacterium]